MLAAAEARCMKAKSMHIFDPKGLGDIFDVVQAAMVSCRNTHHIV